MTPSVKLIEALQSVDWGANVDDFCTDTATVEPLAQASLRLALWSKQLEQVDAKNPALCFIREMQVAGQLVAVSTALAIYKSAAASCRTLVETALCYTYFRLHPVELATLTRSEKWFMAKDDILEYHTQHTPHYVEAQKCLAFVARLNPWYSKVSAVIHGQVPGAWLSRHSIKDIAPDAQLRTEVLAYFVDAVDLVHRLFLCTLAQDFWDYFSPAAKKALSAGLSGDVKAVLKLDRA